MATSSDNLLVIGASGGIAGAIVEHHIKKHPGSTVACVSRSARGSSPWSDADQVHWYQSTYSEHSIADVCEQIADASFTPGKVVICNGILHGESLAPEKRIETLSGQQLMDTFSVNTIIPILWIKYLLSLFSSDIDCRVAVLSARVGSISDNRLGGWYSYRASKSALNMLLKTASIEYARRVKTVKLIAFHPGTTDTALSKPFQQSVPEGKLFTPDFVAERLLRLMDSTPIDGQLSFIDWDGKPVDW